MFAAGVRAAVGGREGGQVQDREIQGALKLGHSQQSSSATRDQQRPKADLLRISTGINSFCFRISPRRKNVMDFIK